MISRRVVSLLVLLMCLIANCVSQTETATVSGRISDEQGAVVPGAELVLTNVDTNLKAHQSSNKDGLYVFSGLKPGRYLLAVSKGGFRTINLTDVVLNVQDAVSRNFQLQVGSVSESVTVVAEAASINRTDGSVSTVIDRNFTENLPMNGRSFQTLIQLTPGVVFTPSSSSDSGQFSVNGQRSDSNYWMVDGVSANIGIGSSAVAGNGLGGTLGSFSALGGTNSLVSVDAMQEFRIQTSTFAPEFGRTPGGQISIVTRSGTNQFHGTAFDFFRNGVLDANNWFANANKLPKPDEKQNDFGGTFSGPIIKDRTFFFFSYEGLRLRLPQTTLTTVPDLAARQSALPAIQPFLNAFPLPNGVDNLTTGVAQFNASYSNPASLDAYSLRIDHNLTKKLSLFGRYNYSPSQIEARGGTGDSLSTVLPTRIVTQTATVGATWLISPVVINDLRFNFSRVEASSHFTLDAFGGAVPLTSLPIPSPYTNKNGFFDFGITSLTNGFLIQGASGRNVQRQINLTDDLSLEKGSHNLKFGIDFRRLAPIYDPSLYNQGVFLGNVASSRTGALTVATVATNSNATLLFHNLGLFGQDTWRVTPRLTLTYGLRWDIDFAPSSASGPQLAAVTGYNLQNLSALALAPPGTPPFETTYGNFAPRIGLAYQISGNQEWQTVLRGGFGVFYDLVDSEVGNAITGRSYPFGSNKIIFGGSFPLNPSQAAPAPITPTSVLSFDPNLQSPYTLQWNAALEQGLGRQQTVTATYIGSVGRRLLQTANLSSVNANFSSAQLLGGTASSDYNALQIQFQRRLSHNLQALASYNWSHSIDDASAGSIGSFANTAVPGVNANADRGPSDFDIRNALSAGLTYDISVPRINSFTNAILRNWALESVIQIQSALPVNVNDSILQLFNVNAFTAVRPDLVSGQPLYLYGSQYPGGKAFNPAAFAIPPRASNGKVLRQGNLGRNALRGFGASQWDLGVHRDLPIHESLKLQFRAEMFNVLNHPSFAPPVADISKPNFGFATQTLGQYLAGTSGTGFNALYQTGGPRSIQLALKLIF